MDRYGIIERKNPREIVLLKGAPCVWGKCAFCDYIADNSFNTEMNFAVNCEALSRVTGKHSALEVINSGSVFELDPDTLSRIRTICGEKKMKKLYFESWYGYRRRLCEMEEYFGLPIVFKCGIETFDNRFRNDVLKKGIYFKDAAEVRRYFSSVCLLVGVEGQNKEMIERDVDILLSVFPYGCINVFTENSSPVKSDRKLIEWFLNRYSYLNKLDNIDLLVHNTDFGVGGEL